MELERTTEKSEDSSESETADLISTSIFLIASLTGLFFNALTILVIGKKSDLKLSVTNFVLALAVYDAGICGTGITICIRDLAKIDKSNDILWCLFYTLRPLSIQTTVLIAVERLVAVRFPHKFKTWFTRKLAFLYLFLALIGSLFLTLWHWVDCKSLEDPKARYNFYEHTPWPRGVGMLIMFLDFLLPFLILVYCNVVLVLEFRERSKRVEKMFRDEIREVLIMRILFVTILVLLLCHAPIIMIELFLEPIFRISNWVTEHITIGCVIINSSANFIIFYVMAKQFRDWTRELFCNRSPKEETLSNKG